MSQEREGTVALTLVSFDKKVSREGMDVTRTANGARRGRPCPPPFGLVSCKSYGAGGGEGSGDRRA